jgi:hypothetical protein
MHTRVRNLRITPRLGSFYWGGSFDVGGHDNVWEHCSAEGTTVAGFALENNRASRIVDSTVKDVKGVGFYLPDCYGCEVRGGSTSDSEIGVYLGAGCLNDPTGAIGSRVTGLQATGNTTGIVIYDGSNLSVSDTTVTGGDNGLQITPATTTMPHSVDLRGVTIQDTAHYGVIVDGAAVRPRASRSTAPAPTRSTPGGAGRRSRSPASTSPRR